MRKISILNLLLFLFSFLSIAEAGPGKWDDKHVPVDRNNGVYCTLDATTIRGTTCRDTMLFDVWVKYSLDEEAWRRIQMLADGALSGEEYKNVRAIRVRYLIFLPPAASDKLPVKLELEKRYERDDGQLIHADGFCMPDKTSKWYTLDLMEQKIILRLLTESGFYHPLPMDEKLSEYTQEISCNQNNGEEQLDDGSFMGESVTSDGVLGLVWGTALEDCKVNASVGTVNLGAYQIVFTNSGMGDFRYRVVPRTPVLLVFTKEQGLVMVSWQFEARTLSPVEEMLRNKFGEPLNKGGTLTWKIGDQSRIIFEGYRNGYVQGITVSSETFWHKDAVLSRYL